MANVQGKYTKTLKGLGLALKIAIDEQCLCKTYLSFIEQPYLDIGNFLWTYLYKYYKQ